MYNLIEYKYNYLKTSESLWPYYRCEPNNNTTDCESFTFKAKITGRTSADDNTEDVEMAVPLE